MSINLIRLIGFLPIILFFSIGEVQSNEINLKVSFGDIPVVDSQMTNCENGMPWRLEVGSQGQITAERAIRLYDGIDGNPSGRLVTGTIVILISGPECGIDGRTWWELEAPDGTRGWSFEGRDNVYQVAPTTEQVEEPSRECDNVLAPKLVVGQMAEVIKTPPQYWLLNGIYAQPSSPRNINDDKLLILRGPICVDNEYLWQVRPPSLWLGDGELWLAESNAHEYFLQFTGLPESIVPYQFPEVVLSAPVAVNKAPIIDSDMQIAFTAMGGGGEILPICKLILWNSTAPGCIEEIFPGNIQNVIVRIIQPDGNIYSENIYDLETSSVIQVMVPEGQGLDQLPGVWIIEYQSENQIIKRAYYVEKPEYIQKSVNIVCDTYSPVIQWTGFNPHEVFKLILYATEFFADYSSTVEVGNWEIPIAQDGTARAPIGFVLEKSGFYTFVVEEYLDEKLVTEYEYRRNFSYFSACPSPNSIQVAQEEPVEYGTIVSGGDVKSKEFYYAFNGEVGDVIIVRALGVREKDNPFIQLFGSDGGLISTSTSANSTLVSEIQRFVLPESGMYTFSISNLDSDPDFFYLLTLDKVS